VATGFPKGKRVHSVPAAQQALDFLKQLQALQGDSQRPDGSSTIRNDPAILEFGAISIRAASPALT
jgi:hypothetical protein